MKLEEMQILCSFPAVLLTRFYFFKTLVRDSKHKKTALPKLVFKNRLGNKACCILDKTDFIFNFCTFRWNS